MALMDKQWGVTPALSTELPTEEQNKASDELLEELHRQGTFESTAETQKRRQVLAQLQTIADAFVKKVATVKFRDNPTLIKDARGKVFTYGSFRLGVYGPGSDIDTLVVAPRYVTRVEYFDYFPGLLQSMAPAGAITDLTVVEDAFVPIIKFEFSGISIDLIFSRVIMTQIPAEKDWALQDKNLLRGLDDAELRSVNGTRVTDEILQLVPEQKTFRDALRAIKLWAQRRAVYANIMGFPGGVAWAMMVARVCQLYPKATSSMIVSKFFGIILRWPWPNPVLLKPIEDGPLQVRTWNPKIYKGDSFHLMPIITPAYPSMCATYNITRSSLAIIQRELRRASDLAQLIIAGKKQWKDLFEKHTFFTTDFKYYISVISSSTDKEAFKIWSGFVESKVRVLVQGLERHQSIALARPFNKGYERTHRCKTRTEINEVQDGSLSFVISESEQAAEAKAKAENGVASSDSMNGIEDGENKVKTEEEEDKTKSEGVQDECTDVYTLTHYIGVELAEGAKSLDLSFQVNEFKEMCFAWDKYKEKLAPVASLSIQHVRNVALPDDVFEAGEVKPKRPLKKKMPPPPPQSAPSKKRSATDEHQPNAKRPQPSSLAATAAAG